MPLLPVLSQRTYPDAEDLDDCWVVATIWAAGCADPSIGKPSITKFRANAGDPDDGHRDGGSPDEVLRGARAMWPHLAITDTRTLGGFDVAFAALLARVRVGGFASLAVGSAYLPTRLQFGFRGLHQVGLGWDGRQYVLANPLDTDGADPKPISAAELRVALRGYSLFHVYGALFEGIDMDLTIEGEDWMPTATGGRSNGVFRGRADRDAPLLTDAAGAVIRVAIGTVVTTVGKIDTRPDVETVNDDWRATVLADGRTAFMHREVDWAPVAGSRAKRTAELLAFIHRQAPDCSGVRGAALEEALTAGVVGLTKAIDALPR